MTTIDLRGGQVKVLANTGDTHQFRLNNPDGQSILGPGGQYEAVFTSTVGKDTPVALDLSSLSEGVVIFSFAVQSGKLRVRRLNPRRTVLIMDLEAQ